MKILATAPIPKEAYLQYARDFDMTVPEKALSYDEVTASIAGYDALFVLGNKADKALIDAGTELKAIANFGVGYDNIDWKYASTKGIAVINTPDAVTDATAELTAAAICLPMMSTLGLTPVTVAVLIGAGTMIGSHVSDSGFWVETSLFNLNTNQGLKYITVLGSFCGLIAFIFASLFTAMGLF